MATLVALTFGLLLWTEDADARLDGGFRFAGAGSAAAAAFEGLAALDGSSIDSLLGFDLRGFDLRGFDLRRFDLRRFDLRGFDAPLVAAAQPTYPGGTLGALFNRGDLIGAFAAGFLGAGVIGLLFGHGIVMELNSVASVLGLLFQLALIVMLGRLIWTWWRDDKAGAGIALSPRQLADAYGRPRHEALPDFDKAPRLEMTIDEAADDGLSHPK